MHTRNEMRLFNDVCGAASVACIGLHLLEQLVPAIGKRQRQACARACSTNNARPHISSFSSLVASALGGELRMNLEH